VKGGSSEVSKSINGVYHAGEHGLVMPLARQASTFVDGYNRIHRHNGIGLNTPADVHYGLASEKTTTREIVLAQPRAHHPQRFTTRGPTSPIILETSDAAWVNKPDEKTEVTLAVETPASLKHLEKCRISNNGLDELPWQFLHIASGFREFWILYPFTNPIGATKNWRR